MDSNRASSPMPSSRIGVEERPASTLTLYASIPSSAFAVEMETTTRAMQRNTFFILQTHSVKKSAENTSRCKDLIAYHGSSPKVMAICRPDEMGGSSVNG